MKRKILLVLILFIFLLVVLVERSSAQGLNHNFLIGYDTGLLDSHVTSTKATLSYDNVNVVVSSDSFKMPFAGAQANISDENGNLLFYTNGCWIADATGDTMQNGGGLNPGSFANSWCDNISGIPDTHSSIILPWPGDSTKYILFHQTGNSSLPYGYSSELFYTVIDITQNGGLGAVIQKNQIAFQDTLNPGMAACKHANGRDWWIVIFKVNTDIIYKLLLTPSGITNITSQHLGMPPHNSYNGQTQFSPDGNKFAYHYYYGAPFTFIHEIRLFNFDRCSGIFSNGNLMSFVDSSNGLGLSFSPNSQYLYFSSHAKIFQLNTDTSNVFASKQMVARFDGYCFPLFCTTFWSMYRAANGKIYITSGSNVIDLNYINSPDSGGTACDVQQHALRVPCYTYRGNVNHPNYYLGPVIGSVCDSLTGLGEHEFEIKNFKIYPNPLSSGILKITYLLPQNQSGIFEVYDLNGRIVFHQLLSPWSSLQYFDLSLLSSGLYQCVIRSGINIATQKLVIYR